MLKNKKMLIINKKLRGKMNTILDLALIILNFKPFRVII